MKYGLLDTGLKLRKEPNRPSSYPSNGEYAQSINAAAEAMRESGCAVFIADWCRESCTHYTIRNAEDVANFTRVFGYIPEIGMRLVNIFCADVNDVFDCWLLLD